MTEWARPLARPGRESIVRGWDICAAPRDRFSSPAAVDGRWQAIPAALTAAAAMRELGQWSLDAAPRRFDAEDWWYRVEFDARVPQGDDTLWLGFDGLAGVAQAWLNGEPLAESANMFVAQEHDVSRRVRTGANVLVLRFMSLDGLLEPRRPRPRWRAPMIEHQQLRWWRTTLLGRMPGWTPPAAAVGPWKDVWLERRSGPAVASFRLQASVGAGGNGALVLDCRADQAHRIARLEALVERGGVVHRAVLQRDGDCFAGVVEVPGAALWWPHTHGEPALYAVRLQVHPSEGAPSTVELGSTGFRSLTPDTTGGRFALRVNGEPVFCRGACWMPLDVVSLRASPQAVRGAVEQARDAGMNMLRVSGATVYEDAAFFDACDALGMLVWQDFMFANMDYPEQDAPFMASVQAEAAQQLGRWQARPSLAVVCGNSEVEQQAAMWGAPREAWQPPLFHRTLRSWTEDALPGVPYWPSSAHGGAFPHQGDAGTTSYYGVGAYLRALDDARRADLSFATECLGFANVPADAALQRMPGGLALRLHHPAWKARTPRDLGAGWDFEDVRDHYLQRVFGLDPMTCRYAEHDRYLALSRVVTGEVMARTFEEWRRPGSRCCGALVWTLRDLWAGAGWGLVDDQGVPKPCWHVLRRALQPVALSITDEGGNGLFLHLVNEPAARLEGELEVTLFGRGDAVVARTVRGVQVEPRGAMTLALAEWFDGFLDLSYAYRFGPPPATLVHAVLRRPDGAAAEAFFFPAGLPAAIGPDPGLTATLEPNAARGWSLVVGSSGFAQSVCIELEGHAADDDHFHLAPGSQRRLALRATGQATVPKGRVSALNSDRVLALRPPS